MTKTKETMTITSARWEYFVAADADRVVLEDRVKALEATNKALNKKLLEGSTWAHKEIAIMDRKHTVQVDKAEALWLKLDGALEALKTISTMIEYFAPARMAAGKGMAFFEEIEAKAGKAAGLPGY